MIDPTHDSANDAQLRSLLADYAAPTPDNGFSDTVMRAVAAEADVQSLDVEAFKPVRHPIRRSWILSLAMGLVAGLLWVRLGVAMPDLPELSDWPSLLQSGWALYALIGVGLAGLFLFAEAESY